MSEEFPCKYCQNAKCAIEMIRLRALNAEMLEGLKHCLEAYGDDMGFHLHTEVNGVIAKAEPQAKGGAK